MKQTKFLVLIFFVIVFCQLKMDQNDEMDGPKVVILEQTRQQARDICRIGICYLGAVPPSSLVYFNDTYDFHDLDVSKHLIFLSSFFEVTLAENNSYCLSQMEHFSKCKIFVTMAHHVCISTDLKEFFPESVQCVVINDFQMIPPTQRQNIVKKLHSIKLPVIFLVFVKKDNYFGIFSL